MSRYKNVVIDGKTFQEHRLVWEKAHGPIPDGYEIHHIDGNGHNNSIENLQLLTRSEHTSLHAKLRREHCDVVDASDPALIQHRGFTTRYCLANKEKIRAKNKEYRETHAEQEAARKRKYYEEHREERLAYNRKYRAENQEKVKAKDREHARKYLALHRDEIRAKHAEYYKTHKAEISEKDARYRQEHKKELAEYIARYREINRPLLNAKVGLRAAIKRNKPPEVIALHMKRVEEAAAEVERRKAMMKDNK